MSFSTAVATRFAHLKGIIPFTFTHNSEVIIGTKTFLTRDIEYQEAGYDDQVDYQIHALVVDFTATPAEGDLITVSGADKRILSVSEDVTGATYILTIGSKYQ